MRFFALETDVNKIKERFCHEGEQIVLMTYYHGLSFLFAILREILITFVLLIIAIVGFFFSWPMIWLLPVLLATWMILVCYNVFKAYIDWSYDFILVTTDKVILVDQTSFFKQEIKPIHLENIGAVSVFTQFMDLFPFGGICVNLKEGLGGDDMTLKYVPRARYVASKISDVVTHYQRHIYTTEVGTRDTAPEPIEYAQPPVENIPSHSPSPSQEQAPQQTPPQQTPPQQTPPQQTPPQQTPPQQTPPQQTSPQPPPQSQADLGMSPPQSTELPGGENIQ